MEKDRDRLPQNRLILILDERKTRPFSYFFWERNEIFFKKWSWSNSNLCSFRLYLALFHLHIITLNNIFYIYYFLFSVSGPNDLVFELICTDVKSAPLRKGWLVIQGSARSWAICFELDPVSGPSALGLLGGCALGFPFLSFSFLFLFWSFRHELLESDHIGT